MKVSTNKIPKNIIGAAGEYFVAAELSRRGVIATLTLKNTPNIDLIASTVDGQRTVNIQVKTKQNPKGWTLDKRIEEQFPTRNFFIVFVDLAKLGSLNYYIVPRNILANEIAKDHQKWKETPGRKGRAHADTDMRKFDPARFPHFEKYKNSWQLLDLW